MKNLVSNEEYLKIIDYKVDCFKDSVHYENLKKKVNDAKLDFQGDSLTGIISEDFLNRMFVMSTDYIGKWLMGENNLEWTPETKEILKKLRG